MPHCSWGQVLKLRKKELAALRRSGQLLCMYVSMFPFQPHFSVQIQIAKQLNCFVSVICLFPFYTLRAGKKKRETEWLSQQIFRSQESGFPRNCNHGKSLTKFSSLCMLTFSCDIYRNAVASRFARITHSFRLDFFFFAHLALTAYALALPRNDVLFLFFSFLPSVAYGCFPL